MGFFDTYVAGCVAATETVFGNSATWGEYTANVYYRDMRGEAKLGDNKYALDHILIQFVDTDFPGLRALVQANKKPLIAVTVRGTPVNYYGVVANGVSDGYLTEVRLRMAV